MEQKLTNVQRVEALRCHLTIMDDLRKRYRSVNVEIHDDDLIIYNISEPASSLGEKKLSLDDVRLVGDNLRLSFVNAFFDECGYVTFVFTMKL